MFFRLTCWPAAPHAGGLYLYEVGSPDVGLAGAGYAARAEDAATVFTNPAGMTRIDEPSLMMGAQPMYLHLKFDPDGTTSAAARTLPGGFAADDGDTSGWMPAGGLYYVHPVNDRLRLGVSLNGYFGLSLDYEDDWVGRYYVQDATLQAAAIQPAVAWKVNDWLSVGLGVAALYGILDEKIAINNIAPSLPDGKLKLKDEEWAAQFNLGVLIEPQKGTRFGLTYLSAADLDFSDRVSFSGLGPGLLAVLGNRGLLNAKLDLGITMPQAVMFSAYHELTDRLALMANLGWQDWSQFGRVDVSLDATNDISLTTDLDYKDTWHVALGAEYQVADARLNLPLAQGEESLTVVPGVTDPERLRELAARGDNLVVLKAYKNFGDLRGTLADLNLSEKAWLVSRLGLEGETLVQDLSNVNGRIPPYLSLLIAKRNEE